MAPGHLVRDLTCEMFGTGVKRREADLSQEAYIEYRKASPSCLSGLAERSPPSYPKYIG